MGMPIIKITLVYSGFVALDIRPILDICCDPNS